ncbi:unnamed protein product [Musa acuminata subsp. malaccensis]|uniref:(wild Malaysian banana) hypothetical protein n=1 Tax=Musa acuminata subsp. malaccensis TaxID=214687 RepID=A0A804KNB6_MUSAM|nr:PREDICTED: uncharacterized protein LOC103998835 [Musa acuminata subsp. malaccensis]XP_009418709.1 PREDICTED: uncharacterized protein LOC103998835 [Musa acuminata subsp. malaccensis]CAG1836366.1 unnamed protein product [Musa acuminata subsp. malaccensis]
MGTESKGKAPPKVVKLDKALKLAEAWVNNMSRPAIYEQSEVEFEGRPSRLGLGAKITPKMKAAVSSDPVEQKLLGKLNSKKKLSENVEKASPVKENSPSDDDENEPESRTSAFVKKRPMPPATSLQSSKKRK